MNTRKLYLIFGAGILILIGIAATLYGTESQLSPARNSSLLLVPEGSPLGEVEFESGVLATRLKSEQEKRLNGYRGDLDQSDFVEVPLSRAIDVYLEGVRK